MMFRFYVFAFLLISIISLPTLAQESEDISKENLIFFLEESYKDPGDGDYEEILLSIVEESQDPEQVIVEFSKAVKVTEETGILFVRLIIDSLKINEFCPLYIGDIRDSRCPKTLENTFIDNLRVAAFSDKKEDLFYSLEENLELWGRKSDFAAIVKVATSSGPPLSEDEKKFIRDVEFFKEESYSGYRGKNENYDEMWEDILFSIAENTPTNEIIEKFSKALDTTVENAEQYARLIIDSVKINEYCIGYRSGENCDPALEKDFLTRLGSVGLLDKTGQLFTSVGENIYRWKHRPYFLEIVQKHPAIEAILFDLFDYGEDFDILIPLFKVNGLKADYLIKALHADGLKAAEELALSELARDLIFKKNQNRREFLLLTGLYISNLLDFGLSGEAVGTYLALSKNDRDVFWDVYLDTDKAITETFRVADDVYKGLPINLAAAFLLHNKQNEAEEILASLEVKGFEPDRFRDFQRLGFLKELISPQNNDDDVFYMFIFGDINGLPLTKEKERFEDYSDSDGSDGWMWALQRATPDFRLLAKKYLEKAGYFQMAGNTLNRDLYYEEGYYSGGNREEIYLSLVDFFGSGFEEKHKAFSEDLEVAKESYEKARADKPGYVNPVKLYRGKRPVYFTEKPLPDEFFTKDRKDWEGEEVDFPEGLELPVDSYQVVRIDRYQNEWLVVYLSHALDPVGEVSKGGFWIVRSQNQGKDWEKPYYLGLQQFFPYVIAPRSKMPLFDGKTVRMEVAVNELDEGSISFPPVGLRAKRREAGLYLEFLWEDLIKDSDDDGLTDIFEHRVGLNPGSKDSDGDGIDDAADGLPLLPFEPSNTKNNDIALTILEQVYGVKRSAIIVGIPPEGTNDEEYIGLMMDAKRPEIDPESTVFLSADPSLFSGLDLAVRFIIYNEAGLKEMGKDYGIFYPVTISALYGNKNKTIFYVIWSASWVGGEFIITKTEDGIEVDIKSSWIT